MSCNDVEVFIDQSEIQNQVTSLAKKIDLCYLDQERPLIVVCILKGSFIFCADLVRAMKTSVEVEFMKCSSYSSGTQSSGEVQLVLDLQCSIKGRDVLVVEDIVDTGLTLKYIKNLLMERGPKSIKLASFLYKPSRQVHDHSIDFLSMTIEDKFVVGYGLDCGGLYRSLPYVGILKK